MVTFTQKLIKIKLSHSVGVPGTYSQPWGTWQKGFESVRAGDTNLSKNEKYPFAVHSLSVGIYILEIRMGDKAICKKLIIR